MAAIPAILKTIGVYTITCTANNMVYVGSSMDMSNRLANHLSRLRTGTHVCMRMAEDFSRYGQDKFNFEVATICRDIKAAKRTEAKLIAKAVSTNGAYNSVVPLLRSLEASPPLSPEQISAACNDALPFFDDGHLVRVIEGFLGFSGMSATQFGRELFGDTKFLFDLRKPNGRSVSLRTARRVYEYISSAVSETGSGIEPAREGAAA